MFLLRLPAERLAGKLRGSTDAGRRFQGLLSPTGPDEFAGILAALQVRPVLLVRSQHLQNGMQTRLRRLSRRLPEVSPFAAAAAPTTGQQMLPELDLPAACHKH